MFVDLSIYIYRMEVNYIMLDVIYNLGWIDCDGLMLGIVDCGDGIETLSIQVREDGGGDFRAL